ncbi:hypothetical protein SAMN02910325_03052 [Ruminococcus flavefaciens]|uniref:Restriction endonuclease n=2 Tax=Ruminococcus flavefaciens TaxID=1265 RepID=A0A315XVA1_RUMFL|nr:hypothetical protein IE37_03052 [Ruminococcus flavefaciens]SSA51869.1 hypothetical protein SAMN02910325_03052 [Ruminococcus flavefaciens]
MKMDKLKYDSFYKFLVSLGVILITLPFAGLIYAANFKVTIIEQEKYEKLSEYSRESLEQKQRLFQLIDRYSAYVVPVFFTFGLIFLIIGGWYWFIMQRELDKQVVADTKLKEVKSQMKQMDASEILKKAVKEAEEEKNTTEIFEESNTDSITEHSVNEKNNTENFYNSERLMRYIEIEKKVYKILVEKYSQSYNVISNVKIGSYGFDAVAVSKNSNEDIIFEIKNYKNLAAFQTSSIYAMLHEKEKYEEMNKCKSRLVYIFVSPQKSIDDFMNYMKRNKHNKERYTVFSENNIEVEYLAEEDL